MAWWIPTVPPPAQEGNPEPQNSHFAPQSKDTDRVAVGVSNGVEAESLAVYLTMVIF